MILDKTKTVIEEKIDELRGKNLDDIIAKETYIPFLGKNYTKEELQAWLNKRIAVLEKIAEGKVTTELEKTATYDVLTINEKLIVDKILIGDTDYVFKTETEWENLVPIILYKSIKTLEEEK